MKNDIIVTGIETNNLKNISVRLKKNAINLIVGPSGSGKSSLAYDTIAQIGLAELDAMYYDGISEPTYTVESYSNMCVTVPIKQINSNNNVRSTIGTYFSLNSCLAKIYSSLLELPYDYFVLNKTDNVCPQCLGVGYTKQLDPIKIIDYDKLIEQVPIRCWNRNKDFYQKILKQFCEEKGISASKKFKQLSDWEKKTILYGESQGKYNIKYKSSNRISSRTTPYYGIMTGKAMLKSFSPSACFFSELFCDKCGGQKYEEGHRKAKLCGFSIGELMLLPFENISEWVSTLRNEYDCSNIEFSLQQIEMFANKAVELNLGYLFLNRNIPSLSGGELQRLRLIKVFSSQLTDLLIILDEPLAGLSTVEKKIVYDNIKLIGKRHTLLIIDHHDMFINDAAIIIALGEGSGIKGGNIIDSVKYIEKQRYNYDADVLPVDELITLSMRSNVYMYRGVDIQIAKNRMNIITGASGVGKSTLLREYFPQLFDKYVYINQKPISGNSRSTVATDLDIHGKIAALFAKTFGIEKSVFSNMASAEGACKACGGTGFLVFGSEAQNSVILKCKDCKGTGFDKKTVKYKICGKSLQDIFGMTVDEAAAFFQNVSPSIFESLHSAQKLLLGHLVLGEKTSNLSGGENVRVKLLKSIKTNCPVFGIDEPFKGLNKEEIHTIILFLNDLIHRGRTIIVVDHEEQSFEYFSRRIDLRNIDGILSE